MPPVFKVVTKSSAESKEEVVTFNTENGDSDSYMDARRAFSDAWHKARMSEAKETAVVTLYENGNVKDVQSGATAANSKAAAGKASKAEKSAALDAGAVAAAGADGYDVDSAAATLSVAKSKARKPKASSAEGGTKRKEANKGTLYDAEGRVIEAARTGYLIFCSENRPEAKAQVEAERAAEEAEGGAAASKVDGEEGGAAAVSGEPGEEAAAAAALNKKQQHMSLFGATTKRLGEMWAALEDAEKAPYNSAAAEERAKHEAAVASNPQNAITIAAKKANKNSDDGKKRAGGELASNEKKKPKLLDLEGNEIKKPLGAFFHFTMEQRPAMAATIKAELDAAAAAALAAKQAADPRELDEVFGEPPAEAPAPPAPAVPEASNTTSSSSSAEEGALAALAPKKGGTVTTLTAKKLGEMWSTMDEAARAPYDARAAADLERYDAAVAANPINNWYTIEKAAKAADKEQKAIKTAANRAAALAKKDAAAVESAAAAATASADAE